MSDKLPPEEHTQQKLPPEDESYISEEKQKEILQKYDPESNTRDLSGMIKHVVFFGLLAFSLFQLYTAIFGQYTAYIQRSIHLGFALSLIFLLFPARKRKGARHKVAWYDYILALLSVGVAAYWPIMYDDLVFRL
ncbi:MAG: TRAP transporter permease, partial [Planococcus donghaensis]